MADGSASVFATLKYRTEAVKYKPEEVKYKPKAVKCETEVMQSKTNDVRSETDEVQLETEDVQSESSEETPDLSKTEDMQSETIIAQLSTIEEVTESMLEDDLLQVPSKYARILIKSSSELTDLVTIEEDELSDRLSKILVSSSFVLNTITNRPGKDISCSRSLMDCTGIKDDPTAVGHNANLTTVDENQLRRSSSYC